ncbi:GntR family transcriptional regulator [Falsiroseomonas sp. HW251]|uniref:GntR family transcriptional regulator n=1 Tax=Falsiroseomonas sp. HW251 TaxID=3390998 RepID=UPI003D31ACB6
MTTPRTAAPTHASSVQERIRADILSGQLPPGQRLQIKAMMQRYEVGQTPLREALNRLSADGIVAAEDQRGFAVPGVSADELRELTRTRCWLEERALRQSMADATEAWEEQVLLAGHRLLRTPRGLDSEDPAVEALWEARHRAFHDALVSHCGSRWLIGFCAQLTDRHQRYRKLAARRAFPRRDVAAEHQAILDAVLKRDADAAVGLLVAHYNATAAVILEDGTVFASGA